MRKKSISSIILIIIITLGICQVVKAETKIISTIQVNKDGASWTDISVSDAYDKCQQLNEDLSALGTTENNVEAHLSTSADWYALSLLTYSDYGSKSSTNTTGNNSGIMKLAAKAVYTSSIMESYTGASEYCKSLIDNKDTKFVEVLKSNREENNRSWSPRV